MREGNLFLLKGGGNRGSEGGSDLLTVTQRGSAKLGVELQSLVAVCRGDVQNAQPQIRAPIRAGTSATAPQKAPEGSGRPSLPFQLSGGEQALLPAGKASHSHNLILTSPYW